MVMDDMIDPGDLMKLEETPFEFLTKATDDDLRSILKENVLSILVFGLYFWSVYKIVIIGQTDPTQLWPWFWSFAAQVAVALTVAWAMVIRYRGGADVWDCDFYRTDGGRATGLVVLDGQPRTVPIEYLRDSLTTLREEYERIKEQRYRKEFGHTAD